MRNDLSPPEEVNEHTRIFSAKKSSWRKVTLGLIILFCGILIGSGATVVYMRNNFLRSIERRPHPREIVDRMAQRLDLSTEQIAQVETIVEKRMQELHKIWEEGRPRVREQFDLMREEITAVLNEEQAEEWRSYIRKFDRFLKPGKKPVRGASGHIEEMKEQMHLSAEKVKELYPLVEEFWTKKSEVRKQNFKQMAERMAELNSEFEKSLEGVLSPEQMETYRQMDFGFHYKEEK